MRENFDRAFALTLKYEGGYVDHPKDPGGATNLGVTIETWSTYIGHDATKAEIKALTPAKVKPLYKRRYWDKVMGDRLPDGLDLAVYDFAVNSGPARACKALQKVLRTAQDGVLGDDTLQALKGKDVTDVITAFNAERQRFLKSLSTYSTFGVGWSKRVKHVQQTAAAWAMQDVAEVDVDHDIHTGSVKARSSDQSALKAPEMQAGVATSVGTVGAAASDAAQQVGAFADTFEVLKWVFLALTLVGVGCGLYLALRKVRSED
jgi:lysozyme family protein